MRTTPRLLIALTLLATPIATAGRADAQQDDSHGGRLALALATTFERSPERAAPELPSGVGEESAPVVDARLADLQSAADEMKLRMGALRACYERELRHQPTLGGTIELRLTVARNGTVRRARVARDEIGSRSLGTCLVARLQGTRFAPPLAGAFELAYPLRFKAR